jgi:hypothetical protein
MTEYRLFPRLPPLAARQRLSEITGRSPRDLEGAWALTHPAVVYGATGGARVGEDLLAELRARVVACVSELGFPGEVRQERRMSFDAAVARTLYETLPIGPGEASRDDVWSFVTLVVAPDIATWRFPEQEPHRLVGGVRNTLQRLWWRAHVLREDRGDDPFRLVLLPEDALVGLMERPALSSNRHVALPIARRVERLVTELPASTRMEAWREGYKRVRQRLAFVNLDALAAEDVDAHLASVFDALLAKFRAKEGRSEPTMIT